MTQSEFYKVQKIARAKWINISRNGSKELSQLYIDSANEISIKIKILKANSRGTNLTVESLRELEKILRKTGKIIAQGTENITIDNIDDLVGVNNEPHLNYINDALKIGSISKDLIDFNIIEKMYFKLNETMIGLTYSRLWADGYNFKQRIWGAPLLPGLSEYWQNDVKNIVQMGFIQNRDILQIAKDITIYAADGKIKLMKRYGELERGTKAFSRRIPQNIDWRALRIARSELYMSLQETAKLQGSLNPAVTEYIWNLTSGVAHECVCPDLAANSPYIELEIPDYPHPNCLCYITHKIKSRDEFVQDLVDWSNGAKAPYLEDWYENKYLAFIR